MTDSWTRTSISGASVPRLPPGVKFRFDDTRNQWVLLAPERMFVPDETAAEILQLVDGASPLDAIIDRLAARYATPRDEIARDVIEMVQDLADKGCIAA